MFPAEISKYSITLPYGNNLNCNILVKTDETLPATARILLKIRTKARRQTVFERTYSLNKTPKGYDFLLEVNHVESEEMRPDDYTWDATLYRYPVLDGDGNIVGGESVKTIMPREQPFLVRRITSNEGVL